MEVRAVREVCTLGSKLQELRGAKAEEEVKSEDISRVLDATKLTC